MQPWASPSLSRLLFHHLWTKGATSLGLGYGGARPGTSSGAGNSPFISYRKAHISCPLWTPCPVNDAWFWDWCNLELEAWRFGTARSHWERRGAITWRQQSKALFFLGGRGSGGVSFREEPPCRQHVRIVYLYEIKFWSLALVVRNLPPIKQNKTKTILRGCGGIYSVKSRWTEQIWGPGRAWGEVEEFYQ